MAEQTFNRFRVCINTDGTVKYYRAYIGTNDIPHIAHIGIGGSINTTGVLGSAVLGIMILGNGGE